MFPLGVLVYIRLNVLDLYLGTTIFSWGGRLFKKVSAESFKSALAGFSLMRVFLDNGSTTQVAPEVLSAMRPFFSVKFGNPQSLHSWGREASDAISSARNIIAKKAKVSPEEVIFTSGGSEANNSAIFGVAKALHKKGKHIITSQIEHSSVLESCRQLEKDGFQVTYVPVSRDGIVKLDSLKSAIRKDTILVSIMHANNETGVIQPVKEISSLCKENRILFHTDAVQSFCKAELPVADLISISAHKIHGPKGVGALIIRESTPFVPLLFGGPHEFSKRAGTQNVPNIVGFAKAVEFFTEEDVKRMKELRDYFVSQLSDVSVLNGSPNRLCNNAHLGFKGKESEALLLSLDEKGVACSMGSACNSSQLEPSHVLKAMNLSSDLMRSSLRFVLSKYTAKEELDYAVKSIRECL